MGVSGRGRLGTFRLQGQAGRGGGARTRSGQETAARGGIGSAAYGTGLAFADHAVERVCEKGQTGAKRLSAPPIALLHNFHLECGARLHKLRVYTTLSDPTGREVCVYLLVRGSVHAHAYALALKRITGVEIEKMLPTPNIDLDKIPECHKYLDEGSHRGLYTWSPSDYTNMAAIWGNGEMALPGDPPGELEIVEGLPDGGKIHQLTGVPSAFTPDYAPEEMFEIATKLTQKAR